MAVWMVRAGKHGEDEEFALSHKLAIIGWGNLPDLNKVSDIPGMFRELYPNKTGYQIGNWAAQINTFKNKIKKGDIIALPSKERPIIAFGIVTGDYAFVEGRHTRRVDWSKEVPRKDIGQDLLYSLGAFSTICQIRRNDAENRIKAILSGGSDPAMNGKKAVAKADSDSSEDDAQSDMVDAVDLEEQSYDQIRTHIEARFKGHEFSRLIDAILKAQGYHTQMSPPGPDGGVDIVAGRGPLGFDEPRLCVQVKSGSEEGDSAIRELEGAMRRVGAHQGLFVSWNGFKRTTKKSNELFFHVRLWDDKDVMDALFENYEKLPEDLRAEFPLKRIWTLVQE